MAIVCSECQLSNPEPAERCKRCKFPFNGEWPSLVSRTINNYKLARRVGGGGFGAVYEARHVSLGNAFAVKILHPQLAQDSDFTDRFQREAMVLAELRHENVLQVIDFGFDEEIGFYLITEWLEGHSLFRVLRAHPKPRWGWVWELFSQLLDALHYAHERGIIHRDLKPENLVLTTGSRGRMVLKIVDFGIAQLIGGQEGDQQRSKYAVGTPYYMAPEQVRGDVGQIGPHTDLYACGVILAEILTGQRPFEAKDQRETMRLHLEAFPPTLAELDPSEEFPEALEQIVERSLRKPVEERFAFARELSGTLDEAMRALGVRPIPEDIYQDLQPKGAAASRKVRPKIVYRRKKKPIQSRLVWAFVCLALLSVVGVAWMWISLNANKASADRPKPSKRRKVVVLKGWSQGAPPSSVDAGDSALAELPDSTGPIQLDVTPPGARRSVPVPRRSVPVPRRMAPAGRRTSARRVVRRQRRGRRRRPAPSRARTRVAPPKKALLVVRLRSKPNGAAVSVNGTPRGTTPLTLRVERGQSLRVELKKEGYVIKRLSLRPQRATTRTITLIEDLF